MTPLFKKLNFTGQDTILVLNAPDSFDAELTQLNGTKVLRKTTVKTQVTFGMGFAVTTRDLEKVSTQLIATSSGDTVLWIVYPKGSSKKYKCEFNRDTGWDTLGRAGFEPVRQVAIDEDWSALRFRRAEFIKTMTRNSSMTISEEGKRRTKSTSDE